MLSNEQQKIKTDVIVALQDGMPTLEKMIGDLRGLINSNEFVNAHNLLTLISQGMSEIAGAVDFLSDVEISEELGKN